MAERKVVGFYSLTERKEMRKSKTGQVNIVAFCRKAEQRLLGVLAAVGCLIYIARFLITRKAVRRNGRCKMEALVIVPDG